MAYKFKVGNETLNEVLKELDRLGHAGDLSKSLRDANTGIQIDQNGRVVQNDPGLQNFSVSSETEVDSSSLEALQELIDRNGLATSSNLLRRVSKANPPNCNPPYDCGNTLLN